MNKVFVIGRGDQTLGLNFIIVQSTNPREKGRFLMCLDETEMATVCRFGNFIIRLSKSSRGTNLTTAGDFRTESSFTSSNSNFNSTARSQTSSSSSSVRGNGTIVFQGCSNSNVEVNRTSSYNNQRMIGDSDNLTIQGADLSDWPEIKKMRNRDGKITLKFTDGREAEVKPGTILIILPLGWEILVGEDQLDARPLGSNEESEDRIGAGPTYKMLN